MSEPQFLEALTAPEPTVRTRLIYGLARTMFLRLGQQRSNTDKGLHHAIAAAIYWHYFDRSDFRFLSARGYGLLYNDLSECLSLFQSGVLNVNLLNEYPTIAELNEFVEGESE